MSHLPADAHSRLESGKTMLSLADVQVLAATAERNGTSHAFVQVALQWCEQANAEIERLRADAERLRWLSERLFGADWDWNGEGVSVVLFEWPADAHIGADLYAAIDAAMKQAQR